MSSKHANRKRTAKATGAIEGSAEEEIIQVMINGQLRTIIIPSDEEDAVITAAALADPDAQPLTDEELAQFKPARLDAWPVTGE